MRLLPTAANEKGMKRLLAALIVLAALGNMVDTLFPVAPHLRRPARAIHPARHHAPRYTLDRR